MKRLNFIITMLLTMVSCSYDDTEILAQLQDHESRIARLETLVNQINTNVISLQTILVALQDNDYVTSIAPINEEGVEIGFTLTFAKSNPVTIYHGRDGKDGTDGIDGKDGIDGTNGVDGSAPIIGVSEDEDGIYYWTLNGEWLTDDEGNKILATGEDARDGTDGKDGQDGVTPQLKIEEDYWYVSYDGGVTWAQLGKATGENGVDGTNGTDGDTIFAEIDSSVEDYVIFTLTDGTVIKLPTWKAFEELKTKVNEINTNILALQAIVEVLQKNDYVTSITPITEDRVEIGYVINFSKSLPVTIYHGKNGEDGINGKDGLDGDGGLNGKDGHSPLISVKQDEDGFYYWTLDGEWLTDELGNRIPTTGKDGVNGVNGAPGQDGNDGVTPQLKIENGYWYLKTTGDWQELGQATGDKGDSFFEAVSVNEYAVVFTLYDGTKLSVPRHSVLNTTMDLDVSGTTAIFTGSINSNSPDLEVGVIYSYSDPDVKMSTARRIYTYEFASDGTFEFVIDDMYARKTVYYRTYVYTNGMFSYSDVFTFMTGDGVPANCYIIDEAGEYSLLTVKGNSNISVGKVNSVEVLWESFGTSIAPGKGDLIKTISYSNDCITYHTSEVFKEGNAVIAAKDASGSILWSWHIWFTDRPKEQTYANGAGMMMDRNLGAISSVPGEVCALGLLYQWGRKDPFLGSSSIITSSVTASTITWPAAQSSTSSTGTIAYSIANPNIFISGVYDSEYDWLFSSRNNELWSNEKTIYDPCPAGYRVPDGGADGIWSKAGFNNMNYDTMNEGLFLSNSICISSTWYPAAGYYRESTGSLLNTGESGRYWSATIDDSDARNLSFGINGNVYSSDSNYRAYGYSVRCLKE